LAWLMVGNTASARKLSDCVGRRTSGEDFVIMKNSVPLSRPLRASHSYVGRLLALSPVKRFSPKRA
jgi:hypothetical protein